MSYPVTRGLLRHGVCGVVFVTLLLVHQTLNLGWYRALFRGCWSVRRALLTTTDAALFINGTALIASSLAMAGEVFSFVPFSMTWWGRDLHMTCTAWAFVLAPFHLGLHEHGIWNRARRLTGRGWPIVALALFALGVALFAHSGLWNDMLMTGVPKAHLVSLPLFLTHYLGITLYFCLLACGTQSFMNRAFFKNRKKFEVHHESSIHLAGHK